MSLGMMSGPALDRFNAICKDVGARGRGLSLKEIADAAALAEEEARGAPDPERLAMLRERLELPEVKG